ncbi:ppGpp synthetase/RelA/SpoT-type nucleotidyltransferase [Bradyrhizobium sp. i1.3.1]
MLAATESVAVAPTAPVGRPAKPRARMMRQYDLVERVRSYNPNTNEDLLNRAYVYAMKAHGSQTRASGDPYFSHPLEVAAILTDLKLDDATIVAALLHDTIEDTEATRAEIDQIFGPEIGALVEGLTKLKRLELVSREAKQAENLRKLLLAIADDVRVLLVKLADRLHNMRTLDFVPPESRRRIAEETLDIYAPLAGRMGMQEMREELEDLSFRTLDPEAYSVVMQRLDALAERNRNLIGEIEDQLSNNLRHRGLGARVYGRRKKPFSIWTKMERKSVGFEQLSDIFGFRLVVNDIEACYRALGIVHTNWPVVPGRFKDYISTPKQNDYRSIHTTVIGPGNQRVELQIRTEAMDQIAERGIAAHVFYKEDVGSPTEFLKRESNAFAWLRHTIGILSESANPEEFLEHTKLELFHDQVFCFTPKGKLIALPRHANVIDFAYAVHTDVGNSAVGCKINGQFAPLSSELQNGDEVEVLTSEAQAAPPSALGNARGHRQGARRDPPRHQDRGARPVCRSRPAHRGTPVRARQDRICRRQAQGRAAAAGAHLDRGRHGGGRPRRDQGLPRRACDVSRLQGGAHRALWRQEGARRQAQGEVVGAAAQPGRDPDPRHQFRPAGEVRAERRRRARGPHRRHRHAGRGDHDLPDPGAGPEGFSRRSRSAGSTCAGTSRIPPRSASRPASRSRTSTSPARWHRSRP